MILKLKKIVYFKKTLIFLVLFCIHQGSRFICTINFKIKTTKNKQNNNKIKLTVRNLF